MPKAARNPRCRCYEEMMEELLTMRQTFEKKFLRLTNEIVDLRREIGDALKGNQQLSTDGAKRSISLEYYSDSMARNSSASPPRKSQRRRSSEESEFGFNADALLVESSDHEDDTPLLQRIEQPKSTVKKNSSELQDSLLIPMDNAKKEATSRRKISNFLGTQPRVLPTRPFNRAEEFEDWNALFKNDEDQRDQLRVELLQGNMDEPDTYIKYIWKSILKDDAAACFSYRGKGRKNKKAIKEYIFTDIFKECFLQRFQHMDDDFFVDRTMRFFNYAQDRMQKLRRYNKKRFEKIDVKTSMDDDQTMDDDYADETLLTAIKEYKCI